MAFTAGANGGSVITSYKYSTDGGATFRTRAAGTTASPLVISTLSSDGMTPLTNGIAYNIQLKAVNAIGDGTATASTSATPNIVASEIAVTTQPVGNYSGSLLTTQPVVRVVDSNGNTVTNSTASITVSASGGTLGGTRTVSAVAGIATFTNLTHTASGSYTLTFASTSPTTLTSVVSATFTTSTNTCIMGGVCAMGMVGPGGGVVFITPATTGNTTGKFFEAAPITWAGGTDDPRPSWWSDSLTAVSGATGSAIGTGYQNTLDMTTASPTSTTDASGVARSLYLGGYHDWFVPSQYEAYEMTLNYVIINAPSWVGNLAYWTSTQASATSVVVMRGDRRGAVSGWYATNKPLRVIRQFDAPSS